MAQAIAPSSSSRAETAEVSRAESSRKALKTKHGSVLTAAPSPSSRGEMAEVLRAESSRKELKTKHGSVLTAAPSPSSRAEMAEVSRAEMPLQPLGWMEQIGEIWDREAGVSRAQLMQKVAQYLGENAAFVGHVGQ